MTITSNITATTITTAQIKALRDESRAAGDSIQAEWCDIALASREDSDSEGNALLDPLSGEPTTRTEARAICAGTINAARAMAD